MSVENYEATVFYHSDSLPTVLAFFFPETFLKGCAVSIVLGPNHPSKARYYSPATVASMYSQYPSFS